MGKSGVFILLAVAALFAILTFTVDPFGLRSPVTDDTTLDDERLVLEGEDEAESSGPTLKIVSGANGQPTYLGDNVGSLDLGLGACTLTGAVTNTDDQPLPLARVSIELPDASSRGVRTDDKGQYKFTGVPDGQHVVVARLPGYRVHSEVAPLVAAASGEPAAPTDAATDVTPSDDTPSDDTPAMDATKSTPTGATEATVPTMILVRIPAITDALIIRATDMFGTPVKGAKVLATTIAWDLHLGMGPDRAGVVAKSKRGVTNDKGSVRLGPLDPDLYNVVVTAPGFETTARNRILVTSGSERRVHIKLPASVSVSGKVTDPMGKPVGGAYVMGMSMPSWRSSVPTETDADGTFTLDGLKAGGYMFMAYGESGGDTMTSGSAPNKKPLVLVLSGAGTLKGQVVTADKQPVPGAKIRPYQMGPFRYQYSQTHDADDQGRFNIPMPKGKYKVVAKLPDGRVSSEITADVTLGEVTEVTLRVERELVVSGVVVDQDGNHVEGAHIYILLGGFPPTPSREQTARTDAEGAFSVGGLTEGAVSLHVTHPLYADSTFDATPSAPSAAPKVRVELGQGARVYGRVLDAEGTPVANEQVNVIAANDFMNSRSTFTNGDGAYEIKTLPEGKYRMTTSVYEQGAGGMSRDVQVAQNQALEVNWQKPPANGTVTGVVMMGETPVAGAKVVAEDTRGPEGAQATVADEEGKFSIVGVEVGRVTVTATSASGASGRARATVTSEAPGSVSINIDTAGLRFRLVGEDGMPLSGVRSNLEADNQWRQMPVAGGDGVVTSTNLPEGTFKLRASENDLAQFVSEPIALVSGKTLDLGDIVMKRAALITGRLTDDAGTPVEGATISLFTTDDQPVFSFSMSTTGSDGRYTVRGVESGRYRVHFKADGLAPGDAWVDVAEGKGEADGVVVRGGRMQFHVVTDTDEPVQGAKITIYDSQNRVVTRTLSIANWTDTGRRFTDETGQTSIDDLAPGGYRVVIERAGYTDLGNGTAARVASGESTKVRIVVSKTN